MNTVALNVTKVPEHTVYAEAAIITLTGRFGLIVMETVFDVAGLPVAQVAFEVMTQDTASLFARAILVYVVLFIPTFDPLSFH